MRRRSLFAWSQIEILESRRLLANLQGIDISGYQFDVDWATVKTDGYTFAYEKATQGNYYTNPYYNYNITNAKAQGIPIGSYDFADFGVNPTTEANFFWNEIKSTISGDGKTLQPMLDAESYETGNEDSWVATWASVIEADGEPPAIRSTPSFTPIHLSQTTISQPQPPRITLSGLPSQGPLRLPTRTLPWTSYEVWQYGNSDSFPTKDNEGNVEGDADQLNGTASDLLNLVVGSGKFATGSTVETTAKVTATQNSNGTGTSGSVPASTEGTVLGVPAYYNNAWYSDVSFTTGVSGWVSQTSLLAIAGPPAAPVNSSPANNSTLYAMPTLTWNTDPTAATYNVYINNSEVASGLTGTSYTPSNLSAGADSWYIQAVNAVSSTNGTAWSFTLSAPVTPTNSGPSNNSNTYSTPTLTWNSDTGATSTTSI